MSETKLDRLRTILVLNELSYFERMSLLYTYFDQILEFVNSFLQQKVFKWGLQNTLVKHLKIVFINLHVISGTSFKFELTK